MVGTGKISFKPNLAFPETNLICAVVGKTGREYIKTDSIPAIDMQLEKKTQDIVRNCLHKQLFSSCMSVDRGGLWYAILKSMLHNNIGLHINRLFSSFTPISYLLSESNSRYLITFESSQLESIQKELQDLPLEIIGKTIADSMVIEDVCSIPLETFRALYNSALKKHFE